MRKVIGIDPGTRRIGVAVSDGEATVAFPLAVLTRRDDGSHLDELAELVKLKEATEIVVGLPTRLDGTEGRSAVEAIELAGVLRRKLDLPVHMLDERYTTRIAEAALREVNVGARKQRRVVDKVAAAVMLQGFLDAQRNQPPPEPAEAPGNSS